MTTYTITSRSFKGQRLGLTQALETAQRIAKIAGEGDIIVTNGRGLVAGHYRAEALDLSPVFPADEVRRHLHFPTGVMGGNEFLHIVSTAAFVIHTDKRSIFPGDTLCGRHKRARVFTEGFAPTCPGCVAIAQGLAARDMEVDG